MSVTSLILASASPRRKALLSGARLAFETIESGIDEQVVPGEPARHYALRMARAKALAVSKRAPQALVLGADTVVVCGDEILLKPVDEHEAHQMLARLSGRTHEVITAYALASAETILEANAVSVRLHSSRSATSRSQNISRLANLSTRLAPTAFRVKERTLLRNLKDRGKT